jgi:hypothetical protein
MTTTVTTTIATVLLLACALGCTCCLLPTIVTVVDLLFNMPILRLTCRTLDGAESEPSTTPHRRSRHFSKSALSKFRTGNLRTQIYLTKSNYLVNNNNNDVYCNVHFNHLEKFRRRRSRNIFFSLNIRFSTIIPRNNSSIFICKTNITLVR